MINSKKITSDLLLSLTSIPETLTTYTLSDGKKLNDYYQIIFSIKFKYTSTTDIHYIYGYVYPFLAKNNTDYDMIAMNVSSHNGDARYAKLLFLYVDDSTFKISKAIMGNYNILSVDMYGIKFN